MAMTGHASVATVMGYFRAGAAAEADVGFATQFLQEAVVLVFQLAAADGLADLGTLVVVGHVGLAGGHALHDVPTGIGTERLADATILEAGDLLAERRTERVGREPAQIAALALAVVVLGGLLGHGLEFRATGNAGAQGCGGRGTR
ncbi:hypothetical protein G6F24_015251 [Rhizopus arrhizus]|nr:hypothetical protein G6F24_015251 [Rhizopus arrhizus]